MDINYFKEKLEKLNEKSTAQFGEMTPQHMVEHLTLTHKIAYGRVQIPEFEPSEAQLEMKRKLLHTDMGFPQGIKMPGRESGLPPLRFPDLETAKTKLLQAIEEHNTSYRNNTKLKTIHPRFGYLNHMEWELFHHKHFQHHFTQFGIW